MVMTLFVGAAVAELAATLVSSRHVVGGVVVFLVIVAVTGVALWMTRRHAGVVRLELRGTELRRISPAGSRVLTAAGPIERIVAVTYRAGGGPPQPRWLLVDGAGRAVGRLSLDYWAGQDLNALRDALGVSFEQRRRVMSARALRREIPDAVPWAIAHVWTSVTVGLALVIGLVVLAYYAL